MESQLAEELGEVTDQKAIYGTDYLIPFMETNKLRQLERLFQQAHDSLKPAQFIEICAQFLHFPQKEKEEFIHGLLQFFKTIDMDGSGTLSWSEFTQFLIDNFDHSKERPEDSQASDIVNRVHGHQDKHYVRSKPKMELQLQSCAVERVQSDKKHRLHILERKSSVLKILSDDPEEHMRTFNVLPNKVHILAFCWSQQQGKHCLVGSDMSFYFVDAGSQKPVLCSFYYDLLQSQVWYSELLGCWMTTGSDGKIRLWKFQRYSQEQVEQNLAIQTSTLRSGDMHRKRILTGHNDVVTCVVELKSPKCLASCGQDGRILLWDTDTLLVVSEFRHNEDHPRYLRGLDYNPNFQHLLLSYGFEQQVKLWCPQHSMSRPFVGALPGHYNSVLTARFVVGSRYCLTIDERHFMRVWDLQNYALIQLISCQNTPFYDICFLNEDLFVIASKKLVWFDNVQNRSLKKQLDQEVYACDILYSDFFDVLVVFTKVDTRFYDGRTGKLRMVENSVTGMTRGKQLITQGRKLLAVTENTLSQFNLKHCTKIEGSGSPYDKHEIQQKHLSDSALMCVDEFNLLVVGDQQSRVSYQHFSCDGKVQLKLLTGGHRQSPVVALQRVDNILLSGSRNGIITLRQFCTGRYLEHVELQCQTLEAIFYCKQAGLVVAKCSEGLTIVGNRLVKLPGCNCFETDQNGNAYIGDSRGNILHYPLAALVSVVGGLEIEAEALDRRILNRREQLDCEKQLKQIKIREVAAAPNQKSIFAAHIQDITVLKWVRNQGGLVSASIDKTVKVWKLVSGRLVLQSALHLVRQSDTCWKFPRQIVSNEIAAIGESLKFIEQSQNSTLNDQERVQITRRLLRKIFDADHSPVQDSHVFVNNSRSLHHRRDTSQIVDRSSISRQLGKISYEIETAEKKREIRSKVERLTRGRNTILNEFPNLANTEKCRSVADDKSVAGDGSRQNIRLTQFSSSNVNKLTQHHPARVQRAAKSANGRPRKETKIMVQQQFDKQTENIRRTYQQIPHRRPFAQSVMRPLTAQLNRTFIRDVKCQPNTAWKRMVRYDQYSQKWTALNQ